ncbi:transglutaminaseTgpA domain-containing protein [Rathayibacter iranicus]|uniref:transglutaminase family protein n=1 Tax=Rathayibacter iranicus TaxID=59737 RepID=UPI000D4DB0C9|nr:DUF3488 and transglutaminase-like domain-containing protein [Rathayibacter iranicus]MWV31661.1 hypothetical protein [Rathayibacter iranicus NCPPB 2253 = VKM Ac-1602]PPI72544.1 hypothetical protein C5E01_04490 [Rathayibacter iranicus]
MSRRSERDPRSGSVLLTALLWLAIVAAAAGAGRLFVGVGWLVQLAVAAAVVLAVPAAARALRSHPVVPPILGTLAAVGVLTAMFVPARALLFVVPTPGAVAQAKALAEGGFVSIAQQGLPAVADAGISLLLIGGVVVLTWAADLFAFSIRLPALTGLFPAALLAVPAVIDPSDVSWASLVVTAVAYAGVLAVSATPERSKGWRVAPAASLPSLAIVTVVVIGAGLLAGSATGYARTTASSGVSGALFNGAIDPVVALGSDLRRPNPVTVLRYATDSDLPVYLRVLTVSDFAGENWGPSDTEQTAAIDAPIPPEGLGEGVPREAEEVDVSIETLRSTWLPVPYPVSSMSGVGESWLQDVQDGSIRGEATTRAGDDYEVQALRLAPDPQQLVDAPAPTGLDRYLVLPDDVPEIVRSTALEATVDAPTGYDRARALQSFFRSSEFRYSEQTPAEEGYDGDGVGVLAAFLDAREGYCVHFASAMAVMARELGIPSRLAIGYQPGSVVPSRGNDLTSYRVLSSDLHAWPELYFEGVGWLPFEPTPSRGAPASYTLPSATASTRPATPGATPSAAPGASSAPAEIGAASAATPTPTAGAIDDTATSAAPAVTLWVLLLLVLLVPWLLRVLQRTLRRRAARAGSSEAAWAELLASARDLGIPVESGESPRAQEAHIAPELNAAARESLCRLRERIERRRYAPQSTEAESWDAAAAVVAALRGSAGPGRRTFAALVPRSALDPLARFGRRRSDL